MFDGDYSTATDKELFNSHMKLVYSMAKRKYYSNKNFDDIVQVGLMALHVAVKKYDRNSNIKFASYAMHRIRFDMQQFVLDDRLIRKITSKPLRKIYFNYMNYVDESNQSWNHAWNLSEDKANQLALDQGVTVEEIRKFEDSMKESYFYIDKTSKEDGEFDAEFDIEFEGNSPEQEYELNEEFEVNSKSIQQVISSLSDREKEIITSRFLSEQSVNLATLSQKFNVSIERIRQIEKASLMKMKKELTKAGYTKESFF